MHTIQISAGIIIHNGKVLLAQRKKGKALEFKWELPGGKLEPNETLEDCLTRELIEELNLSIEIKQYFMKYDHKYEFGNFTIHAFVAECKNPLITKTTAHEQYVWSEPDKLLDYDLSDADIPIIEQYIKSIS